MRARALILLPSLLLGAQSRAGEPTPWLGSDKAKHVVISISISGAAYSLAPSDWRPELRLSVALGAGVAAGVAKEALDVMGFGTPEWADLLWGAVGSVLGAGLAWVVHSLLEAPRTPGTGP